MVDTAADREPIIASDADQAQIDALDHLLEADMAEPRIVVSPDGRQAALPAPLLQVLRRAVKALAHDDAVAILPLPRTVGTADAADLLNVSEVYLGQLLDRGDLPFLVVERNRRVRYSDLLAYKRARDARRRAALRDLTRMNQELSLYERH